jgi:hypothetical protein
MFKLSIALTLFASLIVVNAQATLPDVAQVSLIVYSTSTPIQDTQARTICRASQLPAACATNCAALIEVGTLCSVSHLSITPHVPTKASVTQLVLIPCFPQNQYQDVTALGACFCSDLPSASDLTSCSTCLTSSGAGDLGTSLTMLTSMCSTATKACAFQCDFPTCGATDIACQCGEDYLQNIFNCASCNSVSKMAGRLA